MKNLIDLTAGDNFRINNSMISGWLTCKCFFGRDGKEMENASDVKNSKVIAIKLMETGGAIDLRFAIPNTPKSLSLQDKKDIKNFIRSANYKSLFRKLTRKNLSPKLRTLLKLKRLKDSTFKMCGLMYSQSEIVDFEDEFEHEARKLLNSM